MGDDETVDLDQKIALEFARAEDKEFRFRRLSESNRPSGGKFARRDAAIVKTYRAHVPPAEIARRYGISLAVVRHIIGKFRKKIGLPYQYSNVKQVERNAAIVAAYATDIPVSAIARQYGISRERVRQIVIANRKTKIPARTGSPKKTARNAAIVAAYRSGNVRISQLARQYGVCWARIREIIHGKRKRRATGGSHAPRPVHAR
jgi:transposase-like protein